MKELSLPLSPKAKASFETHRDQWDAAMATLPEVLRQKLHMGQINDLVGWDAEANFKTVRAKLKLDDKASIFHQFRFRNGELQHHFWSP